MGAGHDHGTASIRHEKPLWWAFGLTSTFLVAEVIGGLLTNSLALLSDAAHMGTDVIALGIALTAVRLSRRPPDAKRTYGYARMEALGAMANGGMLFLVAGYILWEAVGRFQHPADVASSGMLVIAVLGLVVNLIAMRLLKAGSGTSLNVKGAYLEVWADMLGSVGVIIGAITIMLTGWTLVDPIIAVLIGLWVLPRTWTLLREAGQILMQGVPAGLDLEKVREMMLGLPNVSEVHDLHAWALGSKEPVLTVHIVVSDLQADIDQVRSSSSARWMTNLASSTRRSRSRRNLARNRTRINAPAEPGQFRLLMGLSPDVGYGQPRGRRAGQLLWRRGQVAGILHTSAVSSGFLKRLDWDRSIGWPKAGILRVRTINHGRTCDF